MQITTITADEIAHCVRLINSIPKTHGNFTNWKSSPTSVALVVACALKTTFPKSAARLIAKAAGFSETALYPFLNGKDTGGAWWEDLREQVKSHGVECFAGKMRDPTAANFTAAADATPLVAAKPVTLATTNKGDVIVADVPAHVATPTAMAAKPGEFATKENSTRCVLDTKTRDILVITTKRIPFGTPEWCDKMVDINSKPRA